MRLLTDQLKASTLVRVAWQRRGGGEISARTVDVQMPGEPVPRPTTDAELVSLVVLEREGAIVISWPWRTMWPTEDHAPLADEIEAAAALL